MKASEMIGLDVGMKRTGIARASNIARIAEPMESVPTEELIDRLEELVKEKGIDAVVVGLPRNLRGEDTEQTRWVRDWAKSARAKIKASFYWQDEALTSRLAEAELKKSGKVHDVDSLAAAMILQDFLDSPEDKKVGL